jgi:predicted MFS family arabinose efflux permease
MKEETQEVKTSLQKFDRYQIFIIAILAITVFTVVLDFMVLSPLSAQLLRLLNISTGQFGLVVSVYAFSAGASGLLAAGFADKYDRKKMLMFFYAGFILGTLMCGLANTYHLLLIARVVTGIFGGVISSISFAIITDLFPIEKRGRVMGFVQLSFAVSQVLGIPVGLYLAHIYDWHAPFIAIVILSIVVLFAIWKWMQPVNKHIGLYKEKNAFVHLYHTTINKDYLKGFSATALLSLGGFMLMPFSAAFLVYNIHISEAQLPLVFMFTGISTMIAGPLIGKFADQYGKFKLFMYGTIIAIVMVVVYTNMTVMPMYQVIIINCILFIGITARMISGSALMTAVPEPQDRGAFMGINSSIQQISGGIASLFAGLIVVQASDLSIQNFNLLGYVVIVTMIVCLWMIYIVHQHIKNKLKKEV